MANTTGLGDTIYAAVRKALEDKNGGSGNNNSGSGGSGPQTVTFNLWNVANDSTAAIIPTSIWYANAAGQNGLEYADASFHEITGEIEHGGETFTIHGVTVEDVPAGSVLRFGFPTGYNLNTIAGGMTYWNDSSPSIISAGPLTSLTSRDFIVLAPLDGVYVNGRYAVVSNGGGGGGGVA